MAWYGKKSVDNDVVLSSRVRLARNVEGYPFGRHLTDDRARELIGKIGAILTPSGYEAVDFTGLDMIGATAYVEEHIVSPEFAGEKGPHTLFKNDKKNVYIMTCEEDHLRIQCITPGFSLDEAYAGAIEAESLLDSSLNLAFDEKLGYLTHCPTNLGTGMRASVMMFLPAITKFGKLSSIARQLSKIGLTVRGSYGEGSGSTGCLYQISNQVTLGVSEEESIEKLKNIVASIVDQERKLRDAMTKDDVWNSVADASARAYGTLTYARMLSFSEFMKLWCDVRLGIALDNARKMNGQPGGTGIPSSLSYETLDTLFIESQPAVLTLLSGGTPMSPAERDLRRADAIKRRLAVV